MLWFHIMIDQLIKKMSRSHFRNLLKVKTKQLVLEPVNHCNNIQFVSKYAFLILNFVNVILQQEIKQKIKEACVAGKKSSIYLILLMPQSCR